jgi:hypothetical protein
MDMKASEKMVCRGGLSNSEQNTADNEEKGEIHQ